MSENTTPSTPSGRARLVTPILALVAALVVGGVGGVLIGQATSSGTSGTGTAPDMSAMSGDAPSGGFGGATSGTVTAIDGDTLTIELSDGSTVTVTAGSDTTVTETTEGSVDDLEVGDSITAMGDTDDDGNVTATSISEGASGFGGGFGGQAPSGDSQG